MRKFSKNNRATEIFKIHLSHSGKKFCHYLPCGFYIYLEQSIIVRTQIILTAKEAYTYFKKLIQNSSYSECDPNLRTMKTFRSFLNFKSSTVLTAVVVLLLCLDLSMAKFTPLEIDNHPCTAEKLKVTFLKI